MSSKLKNSYEITAPDFDKVMNQRNVASRLDVYPTYVEIRQSTGEKTTKVVLTAKELHKIFKALLFESLEWIDHD